MKGFKFLYVIWAVALLTLVALVFFRFNEDKVAAINLETTSKEFGALDDSTIEEDAYVIYAQKLQGESIVAKTVNEYVNGKVNEFKDSNKGKGELKNKDKAVFKNVVDTYKVNDNIIGVRVTTMIKKAYEDTQNKTVKAFNLDVNANKEISLEDMFKSEYKDSLKDVYTDTYVLKKTGVDFIKEDYTVNNVEYNALKEYNKSKILTAMNFKISDDDYTKMISKIIDPNKKMVAITFDDGPHKVNTEQIVDILDKYGARGTFFELGQNVKLYPDITKYVYDHGNEVAIHSWDHPNLSSLSKTSIDAVRKQITDTSDIIYETIGVRPKLVRPPYGAYNSTVKSAFSESIILWNIDSLDWKSRDENQIVPLVMNSVQDGDIILLHDIHATTIPAVERIVKQLTEEDYQVITVSEMLEVKGYDMANTRVFFSGRQ